MAEITFEESWRQIQALTGRAEQAMANGQLEVGERDQ